MAQKSYMPKFNLVKKAPEAAFLGCKICLPDDAQTLAAEIAADQKLEPDDVRVIYNVENGIKFVSVFQRKIKEINCHQNACWIIDAKDCLRDKIEFDLIGATEANIADLNLEAYADFSRSSEPKPRRKFRLIQQTGD
jgi:hypothetical protein